MNRRQSLAFAAAAGLFPARFACAAPPAASRYDAVLARFPGFHGTVAVGRGGEILFNKAQGLADPAARTPMAPATRFETGSVSKWIASMVVLKMVDQGRLSLDAPILRYLPDYRADNGLRVTLRHLLSHSSGVPNDIATARKADPTVGTVELEQMDAVRRYASGDLRFPPGTAWDYSHSNWLLVKAIVERVSAQPYAACVAAWLVQPLGLRDSGIYTGDSSAVPGMAAGYAGPPWQRKPSAIPGYMAMAGGFYSTAVEMVRLMDGVLAGGILTPQSRAELLKVHRPLQHYALGGRTRMELIAGQVRRAAWEDGSNGGFRMLARQVLADRVSVVVFNNTSAAHEMLGNLAAGLMDAAYA